MKVEFHGLVEVSL